VRPDSAAAPRAPRSTSPATSLVANRSGGVTKVYARVDNCVESNGMPGIQTSTDSNILPWGVEECVAWYTQFNYISQRPVAWTAGTFNEDTCAWENQKVWTSARSATGRASTPSRLNGETGVVEDTVNVPVAVSGYGAYGGAVDAEGDFWFMTYTNSFPLVEVDLETLTYQIYDPPPEVHPYGITVDHNNRVWFGGDVGASARFDPATNTWATIPGVTGLGIQEHPDGYMWMGTFPTTGIQAIDVETMALGPFIPLPSPSQTKGVSIDFYGYVWLVDMTQSAWRIDPETLLYEVYTGLDMPYTYSDMTGWGLSNVTPPPQG
jgi:streptogramin lyase